MFAVKISTFSCTYNANHSFTTTHGITMTNTVLVTGGAGFIGSHFVQKLLAWYPTINIINVDKLTYAAATIDILERDKNRHTMIVGDINNVSLINGILQQYKPRWAVNFAAETHVDNSINNSDQFLRTNVTGLCVLLNTITTWWNTEIDDAHRKSFRFLQVSTDEVYGSLLEDSEPFTEQSPCMPCNPYSASKAAADHFVNAYHCTYGLPTLITRCTNNYGPRQYPEKLIPLMVMRALAGKSLPIYGTGDNIRNWVHVSEHCNAILTTLENGIIGEIYNIGSNHEYTNKQMVYHICTILDNILPHNKEPHKRLIAYVKDRAGHDQHYAVNTDAIRMLGWSPCVDFNNGLYETVKWYVDNYYAVRAMWPAADDALYAHAE